MAKEKQAAVDLQKIISEGRDRKRAQDVADKIFGKNRSAAAPKKANGAGGSLASRAGVSKQRVGSSNTVSQPADLAQRIFGRGAVAPPTGPRASLRAKTNAQGLANAITYAAQNPAAAQVNIRNNNGPGRGGLQVAGAAGRAAAGRPAPQSTGAMMIRGRAGPHLVEIRGFAPGTTAADIEEAMRTKGISIHSCRLLQTSPKVTADVLCDSKEDADRVGEFHQQWTDYDARTGQGFQLFVLEPRPAPAPTGYRQQPSQNNGILVDGSMGFEPMQVENNNSGGLYSDQLVAANKQSNNQNGSRRGRGFRGGRGGNNRTEPSWDESFSGGQHVADPGHDHGRDHRDAYHDEQYGHDDGGAKQPQARNWETWEN